MAIRWVTGGGGTVDESTVRDALADSAGDVDLNGQAVTNVGNVDGVDVSAAKTKLDTIETNADVTDATNVAAAGAVMDGDFGSNGLMERTGAGTYSVLSAANHAAAHLTGGSAAIQLATNSQPGLMSAAHVTALEAAATGAYPTDGYDFLVYTLDEAAGSTTLENSGTASSADLAIYGTGMALGAASPFKGQSCLRSRRGQAGGGTSASLYGGTGVVPSSTSAATMSIWVKWLIDPSTVGGNSNLFARGVLPDSWSAPFLGGLSLWTNSSGVYHCNVNVAGTLVTTTAPAYEGTAAVRGAWDFVSCTYDSAVGTKLYINGELVASNGTTGAMQFGTGYWMVGGSYAILYYQEGVSGLLSDARYADGIARSAAWMRAVFARGPGQA